MTQHPLIHADNLALVRNHRLLFTALSVSLAPGQAIHLCGKNGSGKTSLLKVLMGLLAPSAGHIARTTSAADQGGKITCYLGHQTPIKEALTVTENLYLNAQLFECLPQAAIDAETLLTAVGLWDFRQQLAGDLSAGQKRRLLLARLWTISHRSPFFKPLWLLDEPLVALDSDFIDVLQSHIDDHLAHGGGVIFTSHQPLVLAHRICRLNLEDYQ